MEYKINASEYISPGTAGIAQRISRDPLEDLKKETSSLFALMQNDLMTCTQNQY